MSAEIIDLNYGENYLEECLLKQEAEKRIADSIGVLVEQVMLNYGSNSNLLLFFSAFALKAQREYGRDLKVLLDVPNYFLTMKWLQEWNIETVEVQRDDQMDFSLDGFVRAMKSEKPDVVLLTTPNNPTGKPITDEQIDTIVNSVTQKTIVLIDRTCVNVLPEVSTKEILKRYSAKKIVILHSFSKSHSLSDERIGYLVTNSTEIADHLRNKRDLNHNIHAMRKLLEVLNDKNVIEKKRKVLKSCHSLLQREYDMHEHVEYIVSYSNFALLRLPSYLSANEVQHYMKKHKILIASGNNIGLDDSYIRLHMSGEREIESFIIAFNKLLHYENDRYHWRSGQARDEVVSEVRAARKAKVSAIADDRHLAQS